LSRGYRSLVGRFCRLLFILALPAFFYPAFLRNVPLLLVQPDGTEFTCFASGDEFYNWLHDKNGYTIVRNPTTGYYVYASKIKGGLSISNIGAAGETISFDVQIIEPTTMALSIRGGL
jgi:hypothetical protein